MNKLLWSIVVLLMVACGDDVRKASTWGELNKGLAEAYCETVDFCSSDRLSDDWVRRCKVHVYNHQCELDETCDVEMPSEAREAFGVCEDALYALNPTDNNDECWLLAVFGVLPEVCTPIFDYDPYVEDAERIEQQSLLPYAENFQPVF